jgi:hypothetical protein
MTKHLLIAIVSALLCAAWAPPALGATEGEPNNDVAHPSGPLEEGVTHEGRFEAARDHDWFLLYTHPSRQLDLAITKKSGSDTCSSSLDARLLDADGRRVDSKTVDAGETDNIRQLTAPTPARYYLLLVTDCAPGTSGDPYEIAPVANGALATSSAAMTGRPVPDPLPVPEPDDDLVHAFGPLHGDMQYGGTTDSAADRDWFVLYTNPGHSLDVAVTKVGAGCSTTLDVRLMDRNGLGIQGTAVNNDETDHFRLNTPRVPARYYLEVYDTCAGDAYQLHASPAAAVDPFSPLTATQPRPASLLIREPNDRFARAFGPLAGGVAYGGGFRSLGDVDHVLLYSAGPGNLDLAVTKIGRGCSSSIETRLSDPSGRQIKAGGPASNQISHMRLRARRATAYVLRLYSGCRGDPYLLRVDPASAVRRTPPRLLSVSRRSARKYAASGHLIGRLGLRRAHVCPRAKALIVVRAGRKSLGARRVRVRRDCSYSAELALRGRARRLKFAVRFKGHRAVAKLRGRRTLIVR